MGKFVETRKRGWFARTQDSFAGVLLGLFIFSIAFPILFWNEGRAVRRAKDLAHGKDAVVAAKADKPAKANDGKLVCVAGSAVVKKRPVDTAFAVNANALSLRREVEMYQWKESSKGKTDSNYGGSEEKRTEYAYDKDWSSSHRDSSGFRVPEGHVNPPSMPFEAQTFVAPSVKLGGFKLGDSFIRDLKAETKYQVTTATLPTGGRMHGGGVYVGTNPSRPDIGDLRVSWFIASPGQLTVVGRQDAGALDPYKDDEMNDPVALIQRGKKTPEEMFQHAQDANWFFTWALRVVGFLMMFGGLRLASRPLSVIASVIPLVGKLVGFGAGLVAFFLALAFSAVTVAVAWIFYRPLLGILLLVGGIGAIAIAIVAAQKMSD